jgi:hypothetical protein
LVDLVPDAIAEVAHSWSKYTSRLLVLRHPNPANAGLTPRRASDPALAGMLDDDIGDIAQG